MPKTKRDPLPIKTRDAYRARPSESEPGMWTLMQQEAGKTHESGLARVFHLEGAARLLAGMQALGYEVQAIEPVAHFDVLMDAVPLTVDIFADGSAFDATTGQRIPKKKHAMVALVERPESLAEAIAATVRLPGGGGE